MDAAESARKQPDFRFEVLDICALKGESHLIGCITRTHHNFHSHEAITNCLIISHLPVADNVLHSFLDSGVPPRGYVFVRFAQQELGNSLLAVQDLHFVSRTFVLGHNVKGHANEAMVGTVVSVWDSCVLKPICGVSREMHGHPSSVQFYSNIKNCNETCVSGGAPHIISPQRHPFLYNVPGEELKHADDYERGDYVIQRDYLGMVRNIDMDTVVLLDNGSVVVVENSWELALVVPDLEEPLVALPELHDLRRPDVNAEDVGGKAFMPAEYLNRGQFVATNHRNLRNGRWLVGEYDAKCSPKGHVLDIRTRRAHVKWLCPNVYSAHPCRKRTPSAVRPYDNLSSYRKPRELRRTKGITPFDPGQPPCGSGQGKYSQDIQLGQELLVGDHVRFRDQPGAVVKYQGSDHGRYEPVSRTSAFGFDMNEFRVVSSTQKVSIRWQDGSLTEESSVSLRPFELPEQELCPGDLVTLKDGTTQVQAGERDACATPFNEMLYFQGDFILRPERVGVIQSVDPQERLAQIRWFEKPAIRFLQQGNILQKGAWFGPLSVETEKISLYEVMSHPVLQRTRGDLVILPPPNPPRSSLQALLQDNSCFKEGNQGSAFLSWIRPALGMDMYDYMSQIAKPLAERDLGDSCSTSDNQHPSSSNWTGIILDLGSDGLLTVRVAGYSPCEDIRVPWERVLTVVDEEEEEESEEVDHSSLAASVSAFDEEMGEDFYSSEESVVSAIEEIIEYEGGSRIDNESGDDEWSTDTDEEHLRHESCLVRAPATNVDGAMRIGARTVNNSSLLDEARRRRSFQLGENVGPPYSSPGRTAFPPSQASPLPATVSQPAPSLGSPLPIHLTNLAAAQNYPPPSFSILDSPPPADQFRGPQQISSSTPVQSSTFLKRITREHRLLDSSLPANRIYARTYSSRLDLIRSLILGPENTPYEYGPFVVDLYLPPTYPVDPPMAYFHSWTSGLGRINPNLYEEGKVCLSLLGTWPGRGGNESDTWNPDKGSILQVLISLMGLVLVKRPFFNEAGYEEYESGETPEYRVESSLYSEKAYVLARGFVKMALCVWGGEGGIDEVLAWMYLPRYRHRGRNNSENEKNDNDDRLEVQDRSPHEGKGKGIMGDETCRKHEERPELLRKLMERAQILMDYSSSCPDGMRAEPVDGVGRHNADAFLRPLSKGAMVMLSRHMDALRSAFRIGV